jgi:hypothetical protein
MVEFTTIKKTHTQLDANPQPLELNDTCSNPPTTITIAL